MFSAGFSPSASAPPPLPLLQRSVVPALLLDAAARAADAVASEALSALAASPAAAATGAAAAASAAAAAAAAAAPLSLSLAASGLVSPRLASSHRALEEFRNRVAIAAFLDSGPRDVVDVLEDRLQLLVPGEGGVLASARVPAASLGASSPASPSSSSSPSPGAAASGLSALSLPSPFSRAGERASLRGWRLAFALSLELADVALPLLSAAASALGRAAAWLLRELVGRAVGALVSGARAGVAAAAEGAGVPFLFGRGGAAQRRRRREEQQEEEEARRRREREASASALRGRHRARQRESDFPPSWRLGGGADADGGDGGGSWFGGSAGAAGA